MKDQLLNAWEQVKCDFNKSLINSERALQCSLYSALRKHSTDLKCFVEPKLEINGSIIIPDIVVAKNEIIQACIEIKVV